MKILPNAALLAFTGGQELFLELFGLRDVAHDSHHPTKSCRVFPHRKCAIQHPPHGVVRPHHPVRMLETLRRNRFTEKLVHSRPILRVNALEQRTRIRVQGFERPTPDS